MTLPEPPLPTLRQLVRALFASIPDNNHAHWYGTASEALAAAIRALIDAEGRGSDADVWFPAYFCNDALRFVRRLPVNLRFYDVQPDLSMDWERLDQLTRQSRAGSILVLVHYFGFPNQTATAQAFCGERSISLVEDAAHALSQSPRIGGSSAVIFSPRKLLPVPGGGLLVAEERIERFILEAKVPYESSEIWSWAGRRLVQRSLTTAGIPWHMLSGYRHPAFVESPVPSREGLTACSSYLRRLIAVAERELPAVIERRRAHYLQLLNWCKGLTAFKPMFADLPQDVCPYVFPVRVHFAAQRWVDSLRSQGVPASRWPDLPPEVQDSGSYPETVNLAEHTVLLPVHQSLTEAQVDALGRILRAGVESPA